MNGLGSTARDSTQFIVRAEDAGLRALPADPGDGDAARLRPLGDLDPYVRPASSSRGRNSSSWSRRGNDQIIEAMHGRSGRPSRCGGAWVAVPRFPLTVEARLLDWEVKTAPPPAGPGGARSRALSLRTETTGWLVFPSSASPGRVRGVRPRPVGRARAESRELRGPFVGWGAGWGTCATRASKSSGWG